MSAPIVSVDHDAIKADLSELVRKNRRGHAQRPSLRRGRRPDRRGALRAHGRPRGLSRRPLRPQPHHRIRQRDAAHAEAEGDAVRHGDHRALQEARDERGGGDDRDVPGRGLHAPHRGRVRDPLGRQRVGRHRLQPQREGLRGGRGVARPPSGSRVPIRLRRRHLPQEVLGRQLRERGRDGGNRRQLRRLPRGHRSRRGVHRVEGVLGGFPLVFVKPKMNLSLCSF